MLYQLKDLIDLNQIEEMFSKLYNSTAISLAIVESDGNVLVKTKMEDICDSFHKMHPLSKLECIESDRYLSNHYKENTNAVIYTCPRGLVESAIPIIIEGNHLANLFMGQFFFEEPDIEYFTSQAKKFGYDVDKYLIALSKVPILTREQVNKNLDFLKTFVEFIAQLGLDKLKEINASNKIKAAEEELSKREQYRLITENSSDMISLLTPEIKFVYTSPVCFKIFGYEPKEMIGRSLSEFCHPEDIDQFVDVFQSLLNKERKFYSLIYRFLKKDGTYIWVETNGWPIYDIITGALKELQSSTRDISSRKKMEEELFNAKIEAENANAAKSEFLANMSHEIRTPLNAVMGFSELLAASNLDAKQKSYVEAINTAGKSLLTLINDILDLSKIEAGMMEIQLASVNPKSIFDELEQIFRQKIRSKDLEFILDIDENLPKALLLDETRLRQVLLNLIGNAVKFTDKGKIILKVEKVYTDITDGSRLNLLLKISDTGIGIPEKQYDTIFESFKQQSGQSNRKYGGTGLGLSITKKLVEMMNGKISVTSVVGQGSTFLVELFDVDVAVSTAVNSEDNFNDQSKYKFDKAKVLIVDDVESNRTLLKELLVRKGLDVISAENGYEATIISQEILPDAIIMDIRMPVMDGYEACAKIKENEKTKNIPIIALTASTFGCAADDIKNSLFNGFLTKPVSSKRLFDELKLYLKFTYENINIISEIVELSNQIDSIKNETSEDAKSIIENEVLPMAKKLEVVLKTSQVNIMIKLLKDIGSKYNISAIIKCSDELLAAVQSYDISLIKVCIKKTVDLLENFK